jgi:hypothetical protein
MLSLHFQHQGYSAFFLNIRGENFPPNPLFELGLLESASRANASG